MVLRTEVGMEMEKTIRVTGRGQVAVPPDRIRLKFSLEERKDTRKLWRCTMQKIKEMFFSEKGIKVVNTLFFLSAIFYRSGLLFIAYIAWIIYLSFCIKHTESKGSKIVYSVFMGIASILICLNLFFLWRK